eukprot:1157179-Pelagomonas_calceolata.AAC.16
MTHFWVEYFHPRHADDLIQETGSAAFKRWALPKNVQVQMPAQRRSAAWPVHSVGLGADMCNILRKERPGM